MVWRCWRGNDLFFLEIDLATIGPRHDCQHAMWPQEAHKFDIPVLIDSQTDWRLFVPVGTGLTRQIIEKSVVGYLIHIDSMEKNLNSSVLYRS